MGDNGEIEWYGGEGGVYDDVNAVNVGFVNDGRRRGFTQMMVDVHVLCTCIIGVPVVVLLG